MSRYGYTGRDEQEAAREGDTGFVALNAKIEPTQLAPAHLSEAVNVRLRRGLAETRPGIVTPGHFNALPWGTIYGCGVYREVDSDREWLLLASSRGIYRMADGHYPEEITLPPGETVGAPCEFVQAQNKVLLFRGTSEEPLEWDGRLQSHFKFIDMSTAGDGTNPIPNAETAELFANRLLVPVDRDSVAVSDVLNYTRYDAIFDQFKIQSGTNERLVRILPFTRTTILFFKERSTYALENVFGDLSQVQLSTISTTIGCAARRSVVNVGADVFFLSESPAGVYRLQQVIQERLQTSAVPVSDPIEPIIKRINWAAAENACAVLFGEYYLLAVPLDGATVNNALLVFNTVGGPEGAGAWESLDTFPDVTTGTPDMADHDFAVIRYLWESGNGTDLDTRTAIINLDAADGVVLAGYGDGSTDGFYPLRTEPEYVTNGKPIYNSHTPPQPYFGIYYDGTAWTLDGIASAAPGNEATPDLADWTGVATVTARTINGNDVGWDRGDTVSGTSGAYLTWASDNTATGSEAVSFYYTKRKADFPAALSVKLRLRGFWYNARGDGNLSIEIKTYKGGTMAPSGFNFINTGGALVDTITLARNAITQQSADIDGDDLAEFHYDFATGTTSIDGTAPLVTRPVAIDRFAVTQFAGRQRLFASDGQNGLVYLFNEGKTDRISGVETAIPARITTRAYTMGGTLDRKRLARVNVALLTWHPRYSITVNPGGVGQLFTMADGRTRDRSALMVFGAPAYDATDAAVPHGRAHREDYSAACEFKCKGDLRLDRKQEVLERSSVRVQGRWATVTVESAQGQTDIRSIALESDENERNTRRAA